MAAERSLGVVLTKISSPSLVVGHLTTIGEIGVESDEIEVTTLSSDGGYREFVAGFKDAGEVPLAGYVKDETNMDAMLELAESQELVQWEIEFRSGSAWRFEGYVKMWKEAESGIDSVRGFSGSIRISGKPTYYPTGLSI